ncbi:MAG: cytosine deaminase [Candidatus Wallbacteria bacterium HGW-Wallbacteria-1]|jgi:cytosine deaminase|uniref:Cytosine deaminase n=1 Tax=Candidatus Wallbacteria bacterium HGW-Wallbacteria-1 TaxID=2013854 RepID=A0A2N1PRN2_9BACT|nr:MAG: cytosine deaminase [Candidatus Wallbacteria bacterium HGW-Wallbacteria-1]
MDLIITNARLRGKEGTFDIGIDAGNIKAIEKAGTLSGTNSIDAAGNLVTESFCNAHLHLCKVYTLQMLDEKALKSYHGGDMGAAMTAIEQAARVKENYNASWIIENVRRCLRHAALNGNTHIRAFADVDSKAKLEGMKALLQAREEFKGIVDLQVVAFPQDGVVREPGTVELVEESMKMGANVVGGIPWIEFTDADEQTHIDEMMKIAKKYNADISMLVDDAGDAGLRTLEMLAVTALKNGWEGRCLAHHARAMSLYPTPYFKKVSALLKQAGMGVVSDPHTGPLHAKVKELLEEGNLVCLGQDDVADAYYPFGHNSMLEVGFLNVHLLWMTTFPEMEKIYDLITIDAAKCMNVKNFSIQVGNPAHLVVLDAPSVYEALWYHKRPQYVVSHGKLVDREKMAI